MSDLISRQALCEYAFNQKDKCVTPNDIMRFPSAQPETHDKRTETHACDLISRKMAIDAVKELCLHYTPTKSVKHPHIDFVVEELERLPSAQPQWIPCSERLPLTYDGNIPVVEAYIVTVSVDGVLFVDEAYNFGTYIDGFWDTVVDWDEGNDVHVLAWMPRPKPYGGESDE